MQNRSGWSSRSLQRMPWHSWGPVSHQQHGGPAILLLHQCNMDRRAWEDLAGELVGIGIRAQNRLSWIRRERWSSSALCGIAQNDNPRKVAGGRRDSLCV